MDMTIGTFELAITWPDGRQERLPQALLHEAFTSLPDTQGDLRARLAAWTRARTEDAEEFGLDELERMESDLLDAVHGETSEFGLLSKIAFRADGQLVNPNGLPEEWPGVRAPFVLALAIQRFRLLGRALGTRVRSVDVDATKVGE
jgi:hypothetical protein